ncbi:MAG: FAD-binding oxidoreductase, partial [Chloroflexi bacterium]|nr:FAD-binding oxidoreductase [Chloroflexota bacterium]
MAERTAEVIIVGAGVHGCSLAYHFTQRGVKDVLVFEKDAIGAGATGKSSGLVRLHYTNVPEAVLAQKSYEWFVDWENRVGGDCGFVKTGFIRIVPEKDVPRLRGNLAMMRSVGINTYEITA